LIGNIMIKKYKCYKCDLMWTACMVTKCLDERYLCALCGDKILDREYVKITGEKVEEVMYQDEFKITTITELNRKGCDEQ